MKKIYTLPVLLLLTQFVFAETKYWVGTIGNYSDGASWNTQSNGSGTSGVPINTDDIVINRNATITIDGNYSPSSLTILNNATVNFTNSSGVSRTYTINGGAVSPSFSIAAGSNLNLTGTAPILIPFVAGSTGSIFGTVDITGTGSRLDCAFGGGIVTLKTGGKIRYGGTSANGTGSISTLILEAGSIYEVYKNGGSFPTANYHPQSLILNTGAIANAATFLMNSSTGSYGNYELNSPSYSNTTIGVNNNYTFNNFTLTDDGTGSWVLSTNAVTAYTLTINGNLTIGNGCTLDINRAGSGSQATTVLVNGNLLVNGVITETNNNTGSVIALAGATPSTVSIASGGITNDVSLGIIKAAGSSTTALTDITLPASTFSVFTLTSGYINMQTNDRLLFIQNPQITALSGGTVSSHIIGKLKRNSNQVGAYDFPVSNNVAQLGKTTITTTNTNVTEWTVTFFPTNANVNIGLTPGVIDIVSNYGWEITRAGVTPSNADFLTFFYNGLTNSQIILPAQVKVVRWNGANWTSFGGADGGGSIDNTLGSTGAAAPADPITAFGFFALGGTVGVLPIGIEYITGVKRNSDHVMQWKVNCSNNREVTMTLERSLEGRKFNSIYAITADELRCREAFSHIDTDPLPGTNYYRLKLTGNNGESVYSDIVLMLNKSAGMAFTGVRPNPVTANGQAVLNIANTRNETVDIVVTNTEGRKVLQWRRSLIAGSNRIPVNLGLLPAGNYQVTVVTAQDRVSQSFIKL